MLGDELLDIEVAEAPTKEELSQGYEVERIIGKNLYDPETGGCEYHCAFKGYSADHNRWIDKTEMCCDELIADYEAEQSHKEVIAGCCAEAGFDIMSQTCSCGGNCSDCLAYVKGDNLYPEVDQREVQLAQVQEDFDAKIAFAYLHECSPLEVSTEMIRATNGGVEAYEDLYLKINLEYDADGLDFTWVERVWHRKHQHQKSILSQELSVKIPLAILSQELSLKIPLAMTSCRRTNFWPQKTRSSMMLLRWLHCLHCLH